MKEQLITLEEFNKLPVGLIIRSGLMSNSPSGIFMTNDPELPLLKYVVVKRIDGWTAYIGRESQSLIDIKNRGDKSNTELFIRRMFPCTDKVFKLYCS